MTQYDLDLTQCAFSKSRGDLTLYGAWHGKRLRPCLAVLPAYRPGTPLVVEVDDAWMWNPDDPDVDPRRNAQQVGQFLAANAMDITNVFTAMRVVSLIHDHLSDLLTMPPKPQQLVTVAHATHTDHSSGRVTEREIVKRV